MDFEVDFKVDLESPHARESKTVLASGFHAVDFRIPGTGFLIFLLELGFRVPVVGGIPDSKDQGFVFHKRNFPDFRYRKQNFPYGFITGGGL